jgi:hypothetical protein
MRRHGPRQACAFVFFVAALVQSMRAGPGNNEKPLRVKLIVVGQKNCRGGPSSSEVSAVHLKLRLEIVNRSERNLIVAKGIGAAWYGIILAKDEQALAAGIYESDQNIDWVVTESNLQSPPIKAPSKEFTILAPGKSFEVESVVDIQVQRDASSPVRGLLQPGNHVLQLDLGTWPHVIRPEQFRESWKKYGELVYEPVKSEPLPFRVPPEADFAKCGL